MGSSPTSDSPSNPTAPAVSVKDGLPVIIHEREVRKALGNCSHWKIWELCKNDPEFPKPREIAGKRSWFLAEIKDYIESRPRRVYTAVVAILAVVGVAVLSFANFLLA